MTTPTLGLRLIARLETRISPALVAHAELLQCSATTLDEAIAREIDRNPALDRPAPRATAGRIGCPRCGAAHHGRACHGAAEGRGGIDGYPSPAAGWTRARILAEVRPDLPAADRPVAEWLLADLDPRGLLPGGAAGAAGALGIAEDRVRRIIGALRAAGPPGLCASDIRECLLLQLDALDGAPVVVHAVIEDHLAELAAGRLGVIAAALRVATGEVVAAREFLRAHLRPWVALDDGPVAAPITRPDVLISYAEDGVRATVAGDSALLCVVNPLWARLADEPESTGLSRAERRDVRERVRAARAFLAALAERADTLCLVAGYAAGRQWRFLRDGATAHEPLTRAEVAEALGLHESTVSRAVAGKRVRLPDGRDIAFADLFGVSGSAQAELRAIVAAEPRALSDAELAAELAGRGYPVARRTVAKYRTMLGIPACAAR